MTIRRTINMAELADVYSDFRFGMDSMPAGMALEARALFDTVDGAMRDLFESAKLSGLSVVGDDLCFETEAMLFDLVRRSNPELSNEIASVAGLGAALKIAPPERCEQIIEGLERDRDFLASMRERANEFVPGGDDQYEGEMPV